MSDTLRRLLGLLIIVGALSLQLMRAEDRPVESLVARWGGPPSEFIDLQGQLLHYRDEGPAADPVPIVLLHGAGSSLHSWDAWVRLLKPSRRVLRLDLPGSGLTGPWTGPHLGRRHDAETDAAFVRQALDRLKLGRVVLVGHGAGGEAAWRLAQTDPARVDRLVLLGATGMPVAPRQLPLVWQLARLPVVSRLGDWFLTRGLVRQGLVVAAGDPSRVTDAQVERYFELALRSGNRAALVARLQDAPPGHGSAASGPVAAPTLLIWGAQDRIVPPAAGERFAAAIPGSKLVVLDGVGHLPQEEDPLRSVGALEAFLGLRR